jgi:hypothetical protein
MKELEIPVKLRVWNEKKRNKLDRPADEPKRTAKDCPGGKADFEIQLFLSHYFLGNYKDVWFLDDLMKAGQLRKRCVGDMPKDKIEIDEALDPRDFDPDLDVKPWTPLVDRVGDRPEYEGFKFKEQHVDAAPIDRRAIWANAVAFHDTALRGICHYGGIIKAFCKMKEKGHGPLRIAAVGDHKGSFIYVDINGSYPYNMAHTPIPTGVPRVIETAEGPDLEFKHVERPGILDFFEKLEHEKD